MTHVHVNFFFCLTLRQLNLIIIIQPENPIQNIITKKQKKTFQLKRDPKSKFKEKSKNMTTVDCLSFEIECKNKINECTFCDTVESNFILN